MARDARRKEPGVTIQVTVADVDTTEAFYAGILDLPAERPPLPAGSPEMLALEMGDSRIIFIEEEAVVAAHPMLQDSFEAFPKGVGITFHFLVTGIEEIADALIDEGLEMLYPLSEQPYGGKELWVYDPDGYLVVLEEDV